VQHFGQVHAPQYCLSPSENLASFRPTDPWHGRPAQAGAWQDGALCDPRPPAWSRADHHLFKFTPLGL